MGLITCELSQRKARVAGYANCDLIVKTTEQHFDFKVPNRPVPFEEAVCISELFLLLDVEAAFIVEFFSTGA